MRRFIFRVSIAVVWLVCCTLAKNEKQNHQNFSDTGNFFAREFNNTDTDSMLRGLEDFPEELFSRSERRHGAIILHLLCAAYCFVLMAYICNDYFLPSVECICVDLNLSQDVAGATFMAMATSTPELYVNIIGTFVTESDLGVGTVVGSSVFNILGVAAASGLATLEPIKLDWWPLTRDCSIYLVVLIYLTALIWDNSIALPECTVMIVLFCLYFVLMYFNNALMMGAKYLEKKICKAKSHDLTTEDSVEVGNSDLTDAKYRKYANSHYRSRSTRATSTVSDIIRQGSIDAEIQLENLPAPTSPFQIPEGILAKVWWLIILPAIFALFCTVPNCRKESLRRYYPLTFVLSVVWLGVISYLLSWMLSVFGDTFNIPDSILGLTLLAIGSCLPETISSIIMVRQGEGSMGISNSIGANTLDILMCLGIPWFAKSLQSGEPVDMESGSINYTCLALLALVFIYFITMLIFKFTLTRTLGITYAVMYVIFLTFAILMEVEIFTT